MHTTPESGELRLAGLASGGEAFGGTGDNSGEGGVGIGGGLANLAAGTLAINPQLGAPKKSKQAKATDLISGNQADSAPAASAGDGGTATGGPGGTGSTNGLVGLTFPGLGGTAANSSSEGIGGGAAFITGGSATLDNTTITGNHASTSDDNVFGTYSI